MRIYADTSVFGGINDVEFKKPSEIFFEQVRNESFTLTTSAIVERELELAPVQVRAFFQDILPCCEVIDITAEAVSLQQAYIKEGIVGNRCMDDALHVALSTVSDCQGIVSWNFKHIVHFQKIPLYNAVNILHGYHTIFIHSPLEVIDYENEGF